VRRRLMKPDLVRAEDPRIIAKSFVGPVSYQTMVAWRPVSWYVEATHTMCRNIRPLYHLDPPVAADEIRAASLQYVRKISGFNKPSKANEGVFLAAVDEIAAVSTRLLSSLETNARPRNRAEEAARAKARATERFGG
jgi:hypothetical protein